MQNLLFFNKMKHVLFLILCSFAITVNSLPFDSSEVKSEENIKGVVAGGSTTNCETDCSRTSPPCYANCESTPCSETRGRCSTNCGSDRCCSGSLQQCNRNCDSTSCCSRNNRQPCCNQCKRNCVQRSCNPTTTVTKEVSTPSTDVTKAVIEIEKIDSSASANNSAKNTVDATTNLLITNEISNTNAVHIPLEVHTKNVNDFVFEIPAASTKTIKQTEIIKTKAETKKCETQRCEENECQQIPTESCDETYMPVKIPPQHMLQPYNPYGTGYVSPSQNSWYYPQYLGAAQPPNNYNYYPQQSNSATSKLLIYPENHYNYNPAANVQNYPNPNNYYIPNKVADVEACGPCLYCNGGYNPNTCMKTSECSDACRHILLDPNTISTVKCVRTALGITCGRTL